MHEGTNFYNYYYAAFGMSGPLIYFFALKVGSVCVLAEEFVALIKEQNIKSCFVLVKDAIKY